MKKIALLLSCTILFAFVERIDPITAKERKYAADLLTATQQKINQNVKNLSAAQLKWKANAESWSVEDCMKHIAITEMGLWKLTDSIIQAAANPEKRAQIKATDEQVVSMIADRSQKAKAPEPLQPQNTPFQSASEALESFNTNRQKLIEYVNKTDKDIRNHVMEFPFGHFDSYQMILFIAAHSRRHTLQMEEVMANPGFPKQ